jgi:putative SOS response-associated peptidase YedK
MVTTASCPPLSTRDSRMPAILANEDEIRIWLGERAVSPATVKAVLRPFEGSLVMREQSPSRASPQRPEKPRAQGSLF